MKKIFLTLWFCFICSVSWGAAIDFTDPAWTEVDPGGNLTIISNKISSNKIEARVEAYAYYDYGADYFGDTTADFTAYHDGAENSARMAFVAFSATAANGVMLYQMDQNDEGLAYFFREDGGGHYRTLQDYDGNSQDHSGELGDIFTSYETLTREGATSTLTVDIYNDAERTDLNDTLTITYNADTYRWMGVCANKGDTTLGDWNRVNALYTEDLDMDVGAPPPARRIIMISQAK